MTPKRLRKFRDVLDHRQPDLTVLMENVHKPHNLAAIARTCDAVGIPHVHAVSQYALTQLTQKSASGTGKWVNIHTHRTLEEAYATLRRSGFHLLAAHFFPDARDFRDIDYRRPTAIVVGAERDGISERAVSGADDRIFIPMAGMVESLNVSVATALILFEAKRQRQRAGFYETPRLDKDLQMLTVRVVLPAGRRLLPIARSRLSTHELVWRYHGGGDRRWLSIRRLWPVQGGG